MKKDVLIRLQAGSMNELLTMIKKLGEILEPMSSLDDLKQHSTVEDDRHVPIAKVVVVDNK